MKRFATVCVLALLLVSVSVAQAAEAAMKIGYVDLTKVLMEYNRRKLLENDLRTLGSKLREGMQAKLTQLNAMRTEIEQLAKGTPERVGLEEKAKTLFADAQRQNSENQKLLNARTSEMLRDLFGDVTKVVQEIGREQGYDLILKDQSSELKGDLRQQTVLQITQQVVLYSKPEHEISALVIERLNARFGAEGQAPAQEQPK